MEETEFYKKSHKKLQDLATTLEDNDRLEIDYLDGVLYINLENLSQYVLNVHLPSKQIWFSSPISGADYFYYDEFNHIWINKMKVELDAKLKDELA